MGGRKGEAMGTIPPHSRSRPRSQISVIMLGVRRMHSTRRSVTVLPPRASAIGSGSLELKKKKVLLPLVLKEVFYW